MAYTGALPLTGTVSVPERLTGTTTGAQPFDIVDVHGDSALRCVWLTVIDDIGAEYFSAFSGVDIGLTQPLTPNITAEALAGLALQGFEASPICGPTRAMFNTGRYAFRTGFGTNVQLASPTFKLPDSEVFFAAAVRDGRGVGNYLRGLFGKYHITHPDGYDTNARDHGWNRGHIRTANAGNNVPAGDLDHYIWQRVTWNGPTASCIRAQVGNVSDFVDENTHIVGSNTTYDTDDNWAAGADARALVAWANANATRGLVFAWTPNPPHDPFQCPPHAYLSAPTVAALNAFSPPIRQGEKWTMVGTGADPDRARACFFAAIEAVDYWYGWIKANLDPLIMERCTRIGIGDNGTVGEMVQAPFTAQHGKRTVYRQGCVAPAWVAGSLVGAPGRVSNHFCHPVDIWPTILDITRTHVEYSGADDRTIDGISFYKLIRNPAAAPARPYIWQHTFGPNILDETYPPTGMNFERIAIRETQWSYIERWESGDRTFELYNLIDDPWEAVNLNDGSVPPNIAAELARLQAKAQEILAS